MADVFDRIAREVDPFREAAMEVATPRGAAIQEAKKRGLRPTGDPVQVRKREIVVPVVGPTKKKKETLQTFAPRADFGMMEGGRPQRPTSTREVVTEEPTTRDFKVRPDVIKEPVYEEVAGPGGAVGNLLKKTGEREVPSGGIRPLQETLESAGRVATGAFLADVPFGIPGLVSSIAGYDIEGATGATKAERESFGLPFRLGLGLASAPLEAPLASGIAKGVSTATRPIRRTRALSRIEDPAELATKSFSARKAELEKLKARPEQVREKLVDEGYLRNTSDDEWLRVTAEDAASQRAGQGGVTPRYTETEQRIVITDKKKPGEATISPDVRKFSMDEQLAGDTLKLAPERAEIHDTIIEATTPKAPKKTGQSYFLGGSQGAGKTEARKLMLGGESADDLYVVDPDLYKDYIPEYGYEKALAKHQGRSPDPGYVHDESSMLSMRQAGRAIETQSDFLSEGTAANLKKELALIEKAKEKGYTTNGGFIYQDKDQLRSAWKYRKDNKLRAPDWDVSVEKWAQGIDNQRELFEKYDNYVLFAKDPDNPGQVTAIVRQLNGNVGYDKRYENIIEKVLGKENLEQLKARANRGPEGVLSVDQPWQGARPQILGGRQLNPQEVSPSLRGALSQDVGQDLTQRATTQGPVPERAGNILIEKITDDQSAQRLIYETAEDLKRRGVVNEATRGAVTWEESQKLADTMGVSWNKKIGEAYSAEELLAVNDALRTSASEVSRLGAGVREGTISPEKFKEAWMAHVKLMRSGFQARAEAGRSLQILRKNARGLTQAEKNFEKLAKAAGGDEQLLKEMSDKLAAFDPEDTQAINGFIREASKVSTWDKVHELWMSAILSGPTTHIVNSVSNTITAMIRPALERPFAVGFDVVRSALTGAKRTRFAPEMIADVIGMTHGVRNGARAFLRAWATETPGFGGTSKFERVLPAAIKGKIGKTVRMPMRFLAASDDFFKHLNYTGDLYARAIRQASKEGYTGGGMVRRASEIIASPSSELQEKAIKEAVYRTFQQESDKTISKISKLRDIPGVRYILPFVRTPYNITKFSLERSPLKAVDIAKKLYKGEMTLGSGELADDIGKMVVGSTLAGAVAGLAMEGKITGHGPKDFTRRRAWLEENRPYSIKVGDKWYSYQRMEPFGMVMGLVSDFVELRDQIEPEDSAFYISAIMAQNLLNKTFMRGLSDALEAVSDPERYADRWFTTMAGSIVPNIVAQPARAMDPNLRRPETVTEAWMSRLPYLREKIPPIIGIWGDPIEIDSTWSERLLNPTSPMRLEADKATKEVNRLGINVGSPRRQLGDVELTQEEYVDYAMLSGRMAKEAVDKIVGSRGYARMSDERKIESIERVMRRAKSRATRMYKQRRGGR